MIHLLFEENGKKALHAGASVALRAIGEVSRELFANSDDKAPSQDNMVSSTQSLKVKGVVVQVVVRAHFDKASEFLAASLVLSSALDIVKLVVTKYLELSPMDIAREIYGENSNYDWSQSKNFIYKKPTNRSDFCLVHIIDLSWNPIEQSLRLLYEKLVDLGFVYIDGEIIVIDPPIEKNMFHVDSKHPNKNTRKRRS